MKTIRQTATIRGATPHDLYETIMDSKKHTKLSRQPRADRADLACEQLAERHVFEGHLRARSRHRWDPRHLHPDRGARRVLRRDQQGLARLLLEPTAKAVRCETSQIAARRRPTR